MSKKPSLLATCWRALFNGRYLKRVSKYDSEKLDDYLTTNPKAAYNSVDSREVKTVIAKIGEKTNTPNIAFKVEPYKKRIRF